MDTVTTRFGCEASTRCEQTALQPPSIPTGTTSGMGSLAPIATSAAMVDNRCSAGDLQALVQQDTRRQIQIPRPIQHSRGVPNLSVQGSAN